MSKQRIDNYIFNAVAKTITFTDYITVDKGGLFMISNGGKIIYNFADENNQGIIVGNVLTLVYDTSTMNNNDKLTIVYDDTKINAATEELLELLRQQIESDSIIGRQLLQLLKPLGILTSASGRLQVDTAGASVTAVIAANQDIRTVTTVSSVTNQVNMGGLNALDLQFNMAHTAWNTGTRSNITF